MFKVLTAMTQVSNHISVGDLMALYARPERYVHLVTARLPKRVTQVQCPPLVGLQMPPTAQRS